jgi:TRAP transporter TAXI family solute receptor
MVIPVLTPRQRLLAGIAIVVLVVFGAWAIVKFVSPDPPRSLSLSTGAADGAYHQFGLKYQQLLQRNGITLDLQHSSGSVENLKRLNDGTASVGLVQGGLGFLSLDPQKDADETPLRSLATIAYEPVWIFSHTLDLSRGLSVLKGRQIAVGVTGSGSRKLAIELLSTYGLTDAAGQPLGNTRLVDSGGVSAASKLVQHELDAVIMVAAPQAVAVQQLLENPTIRLASLDHVEGLARRFPYFQPVILKRGSVDPGRNIPAQDVQLLATTANLVISDSLHPALAYLLLEAAQQTHGQPSLLNRPGEFPSPKATDFPLAEEADRYFRNGRPFLQRYLPFWLANFVQRLILMLIPLVAVLVPVFKVLPALLEWKEKNRLFRRYGELKFLEKDLTSRTFSPEEKATALARLDAIEAEIGKTRFPLDFSDRVYTLRQHVDYVRSRLER